MAPVESKDLPKLTKEEEDKMINNILAKHGIKLGERKPGEVPATKDSTDKILDNMDAQLNNVKIRKQEKQANSVNGDLERSEINDIREQHSSLPISSSTYGYKARSLNDLSRSYNYDDTIDPYEHRSFTSRKPSQAFETTVASTRDWQTMPLLDIRDLDPEKFNGNMSLPSSISYPWKRSWIDSDRTSLHRSLQDISLRNKKPIYTSTPFVDPKINLVGGYQANTKVCNVEDNVPEVVKKQEEYEWRLKKMISEQEKSESSDASLRIGSTSHSSKKSILKSSGNIDSIKSGENENSNHSTIQKSKGHKSSGSGDAHVDSLTGTYRSTDYHLVPEFISSSSKRQSECTSESIGKSSDEPCFGQKVYKARKVHSSYSGSYSSDKLENDSAGKIASPLAANSVNSIEELQPQIPIFSQHSNDDVVSTQKTNSGENSDFEVTSISSSTRQEFESHLRDIAKEYVEHQEQDKDDGTSTEEQLDRTLTPTNIVETNSETSSGNENVLQSYTLNNGSVSTESTSTLHTADVPKKLRDSIVRFSSDDRSSLEFTLHVSSTDIESLPTSGFEENWRKRQQTRFPELTPVDDSKLSYRSSSSDSPRSKRKLTKRERMKVVLQLARSHDIDFKQISSSASSSGIIVNSVTSMTTEDLVYADSSGLDIMSGNHSSRMNRSSSVNSFSTTQTEDFEDRYRQIMVRHVAGVPLTSFDNVTIASDLDSIKTETVHRHFADSIAQRNNTEKIAENGHSTGSVSKHSENRRSRSLRDRFNQLKSSSQEMDSTTSESSSSEVTRPSIRRPTSRGSSFDLKPDPNNQNHNDTQENGSACVRSSTTSGRGSTLPDYPGSVSRGSSRLQASELSSSSHRRSMSHNRVLESRERNKSSDYQYSATSARRHSDRSTKADESYNQSNGLQTTTKLRNLENEILELEAQKKAKAQEVTQVEATLEKHGVNLLKLEEKMRENQSKADDARAELMVLEFKRDQARSDLEQANTDLDKLNHQIKQVNEEQVLSYDEMIALVQERDDLKARIRRGEASAITIQERQELERALHLSKEELFRERKLGRIRVEDLEEKVEEVEHNFEVMESEKNTEISRLEAQIQALKKEAENKSATSVPPVDRNGAIEAEKKQLYEQIEELRTQLLDKDKEIVSLATDGNKKRDEIAQLQKQGKELESKLSDELKLREKLIGETEKQISNLKKDKERTLSIFETEKTNLSKQNEREVENAKEKAILEHKLQTQDEIASLKSVIESKQREIERLNLRITQLENSSKANVEKLKQDSQDQVKAAVAKERFLLDQEKESFTRREEAARREATESTRFLMQQEIDEARNRCKIATEQISKLSKEIDDQRKLNRDLHQEKLEVAAKAREEFLQEQKKKNDQFKSDLEQQCQLELSQYRNKIVKLEDDCRKMRQEKNDATMKCKEATANFDRFERTVSGDIFEESQKLSDLVQGIRTPSQSRNRGSSVSSRSSSLVSRSRNMNYDASVSNLRNVCDDVRATLRDLTTEVETHKRASQITQRELDRVNTTKIPPQLHVHDLTSNQDETNVLKQKLSVKDEELREIQRSMAQWKDTTAQRLARKFEEELELQLERRMGRQRVEYQRQIDLMESELARANSSISLSLPLRESKLSTPIVPANATSPIASGKTSPSGSPGQTSTVKLLRHLQGRVKQLRAENDLLRSNSQITDYDSYRVGR